MESMSLLIGIKPEIELGPPLPLLGIKSWKLLNGGYRD